jgi:hypothetical protein
MAKQSGPLSIRGTIGNLTHRHTQDGDIVQRKTSIDRERFMNDPKFEGSRGGMNEFTLAAQAAGLLSKIFREGIAECSDNRIQSRLTQKLQKVIYADNVSKNGERNLLMGDILLLNNFWWNKEAQISNILGASYQVKVDRATGEVTFNMPSFVPNEVLKSHPTATHFQIIASTAEIDWIDNGRKAVVAKSDFTLVGEIPTKPFTPVLSLTKNSTLPIVSCLAIRWYQRIAGEMEGLYDKKYNTAGVVDVNVR